MGLIYEDERYFSASDVNRFDAEKFDRFIDCLAHDIDRYTADAKILENGYGKYYHNTTYVGQAANASKEFIDRKQFDKFHVESKEVQKELFYKCTDVRDMFREQVDSSPKARIDSETLEFIKRDYRDYYDELEHEGYDIECMAREIENYYGKYGKEVTQPNYRRSMEVYDELCCHGGFMDKCIRKFENFNEDARQHMKRSMIKEHSYDLQKDIKATASSLEGMTVFKTEVERQSVWVNALNASNVVVDPEKLATDIREIIKLSGLKYDKNALIDANIIKTATNLALLNCKSKDEKVLIQNCSASMVSAAAIGPISWDVIYGIVAAAIKAIGASQPWAIAITAFVLLICFVLSCSHDIKRGFERFVSPKEKEENSHIIDIPPKEDKKTIIEGPTAVPQKPSVTDIPSGKVEEKELGHEIFPKTPADEDKPKIMTIQGNEDGLDYSNSDYGKSVVVSEEKMYQQGKHYNKHGRDMGYSSKKEYEQGARDFLEKNRDVAEIYEGTWNDSRGSQAGQRQIIIRHDGKQLIINKETNQIIDYYEGTDLGGFKDLERVQ